MLERVQWILNAMWIQSTIARVSITARLTLVAVLNATLARPLLHLPHVTTVVCMREMESVMMGVMRVTLMRVRVEQTAVTAHELRSSM